jgi:ribosomal protein S18 acetylase RimI-like enzyme
VTDIRQKHTDTTINATIDATIDAVTESRATSLLEHNLWSMWSQFGRAPGCRLIESATVTRFETPIGRRPYNTVLRFTVDRERDGEQQVDAVLAEYRRRGVPVTWIVHPSTRPTGLAALLAARGLRDAEPIDGMIARLDRVDTRCTTPLDVTIEPVDGDNLDMFVDLVCVRYGLDTEGRAAVTAMARAAGIGEEGSATQSWIARRGDTALAKATIHADGDCVGLYGVATRPDARGRGLARAVTAAALDAARTAGQQLGVLHSTPMAVGLYRSIGFEHAADFALVG